MICLGPLVQALGNDIELQSTTVFSIFARFLYVFSASLVVGLTFGLGTAVLLKVLKSNSAPQVCSSSGTGKGACQQAQAAIECCQLQTFFQIHGPHVGLL